MRTRTSNRVKALLIGVVIVCWGAIGVNVYLNFFKKSVESDITVLDLPDGQTRHVSR